MQSDRIRPRGGAKRFESNVGFLATMTLVGSIGIAASTIYVPSVPMIALTLGASIPAVQQTFVSYLTAFAGSMLLLGPLSDRYGRRRTLLAGIALATLGSLVGALSPSIEVLIGARFLQGVGACAGLVVGRALVRDRYGGEGAARVIAGLSFAITVTQAMAPVLGGYLQEHVGWRASLWVIASAAALAFVLVVWHVSPSTAARTTTAQTSSPPEKMLQSYCKLLATRRFLCFALAAAGAHAGFQLFSAGGSAVLVGRLGLSPEAFGFYAGLPPAGFLVGSFLSARFSRNLGIERMVGIGGIVILAGGALMLGLAVLRLICPLAVIGPVAIVCCGSGLVTPNAVAGALDLYPRISGAASGMISFLQMASAAVATGALACLPATPFDLAAMIATAAGVAMAAASLLRLRGVNLAVAGWPARSHSGA